MCNNNFKSLSNIRHVLSEGQEIWFACLVINYEWVENILDIEEIIEPMQVVITNQMLVQSHMLKEDNFLIRQYGLNDVIKKYDLILYFNIGISVKANVFEQQNQEFRIIFPRMHFISYRKNDIEKEFYQTVIKVKNEIDLKKKKHTEIKQNEEFEIFKKAYNDAIEKYPEEVIKINSYNILYNNIK